MTRKRTHCRRGHDITDPASYYHGSRGERRCKECKRVEYFNKRDTHDRNNETAERARVPIVARMLHLIGERERCSVHWERAEIDREYEALRQQLG